MLFNSSRGQDLQDEERPIASHAMFSAQSAFSELSEDSHINQRETTSTPLACVWLLPPQITSKQAELHNNGWSHAVVYRG
jgi:hypothetical protein